MRYELNNKTQFLRSLTVQKGNYKLQVFFFSLCPCTFLTKSEQHFYLPFSKHKHQLIITHPPKTYTLIVYIKPVFIHNYKFMLTQQGYSDETYKRVTYCIQIFRRGGKITFLKLFQKERPKYILF